MRGRLEVLQQARAGLARLRMPERSFAAGYVAALADVMAGYEAVAAESAEVTENAEVLLRTGVRDVLSALHDGIELPSAIAERIGRPRETISRTLAAMREAGLVQDHDPPPAGDQRQRPHSLTPRGLRVAERLPQPLSEDARRGLTFAVHAFGKLARVRSTAQEKLGEVAEKDFGSDSAGRLATESFLQAACAESIVSREEGIVRLLPTRADAGAVLLDVLMEAMTASRPAIIERLKGLMGQERHLVVRSRDRAKEWRTLLATGDLFGRFQMLDIPTADLDLVNVKRLEQAVFLYDDPEEYREHYANQAIARVLASAAKRACIANDSQKLPERVERVRLEELLP